MTHGLGDPERLQVYYPHLEETVESLQVRRVLRKMDRFLVLMHEGLAAEEGDERTLHVNREILASTEYPKPIEGRLQTAFAIPPWALSGEQRVLGRSALDAEAARARFRDLLGHPLGDLQVVWTPLTQWGPLMGTARVGARIQPFALYLRSISQRLCVRCISPVGEVGVEGDVLLEVIEHARELPAPVAGILGREDGSYDVTVEDDVLLGAANYDAERVTTLVRRVVNAADTLEQDLIAGRDAALSEFAVDLAREEDVNA